MYTTSCCLKSSFKFKNVQVETLISVLFLFLSQPGQVYFISDGKPINNFKFFKPLVSASNWSLSTHTARPIPLSILQVEGLGYSYPRVGLPLSLIYFIGEY